MRGLVAVAVLALAGVVAAIAFAAPQAAPVTACSGKQVTLFDNTNVGVVGNGGAAPAFATKGIPYCVTYIQTYHWNGGQGQAPGTLGLKRVVGPPGYAKQVGPFQAKASAGQNNAPNVNWYVGVPPIPAGTEINGTYRCVDSGPGTWSADKQSGGDGFCIVYGVPAPCKCMSLSVKLSPALFTKRRLRADQQNFGIGFQWAMTCSGGAKKCTGKVYIEPPVILAGSLPAPKTNLQLDVHKLVLTCGGKCGGLTTGTAAVQMKARGQLNKLFGRTLAFRIITTCWNTSTRTTVKVFIGSTGKFKPAP